MQNLLTPKAAHAASLSIVEKTDDLISALKLVRSTFAAGNVAANAPAATDREPTSDEQAAPGLLQTINAYLEGKETFCRGSLEEQDSDAFVSSTYGDAYGRLKSWERGAATRHEALAALRLADDELANGDDELGLALVRAARLYFDLEAKPINLPSSAEVNRASCSATVSEVDELYDAFSSVLGCLKIAHLALDERSNFFSDFSLIDANEALRFCDDLKASLKLPVHRIEATLELLSDLTFRARGSDVSRGV